MDYEKKLMESGKANAPKGFVSNTIKYIQIQEEKLEQKTTVKIEYPFFKLGQICVAAALLLIILNITPLNKIVYGQDKNTQPKQHQGIIEKAMDKLEDFGDEIKEIFDFEKIITDK
ncbi:MAG: hypothetical protein AB1Z23_00130 [Eubacteriales bacterium]